jgi:hypothetical protein
MADGKRVALVIGNSAYSSASLLKNPANDARDIASALTRIGFSGVAAEESTDSVSDVQRVVPLFDLNYDRLRRAIAAFARVAEDADQAVFYYAGHGIEVGGRNYLIPIDAKLQHSRDVEFETASLDQVMGAVEDGRGLRLIILDACRDNPFRSRMFSTRTLSRGLSMVEPCSSHMLIAYSSKQGTVALDGNKGNSPYAVALLNYLEQPGLEIFDLFREVQDYVLEATGNRQEPRIYGSLGRRKYYFVPPPTRPENPAPLIIEKALSDQGPSEQVIAADSLQNGTPEISTTKPEVGVHPHGTPTYKPKDESLERGPGQLASEQGLSKPAYDFWKNHKQSKRYKRQVKRTWLILAITVPLVLGAAWMITQVVPDWIVRLRHPDRASSNSVEPLGNGAKSL